MNYHTPARTIREVRRRLERLGAGKAPGAAPWTAAYAPALARVRDLVARARRDGQRMKRHPESEVRDEATMAYCNAVDEILAQLALLEDDGVLAEIATGPLRHAGLAPDRGPGQARWGRP